jgi:tRNA(Arg) A34 adenosine deaminase TadA
MGLAIDLARENIRQGSGGPFGAVVLAAETGRVVSVGVNLVLSSRCSIAHAEIVALGIAQQGLGSHDLTSVVSGGCTLISSAEPCAMCMGAIPWAGVRHLVCGARDGDVRAVGFDEGHKPGDWASAFARRGIRVTQDCLRERAVGVLREYARSDGPIY